MLPLSLNTSAWLPYAAGILLAANLISFALMGIDKARAIRRARRISERTLMLASACFASIGGIAGMLIFRHKTRHHKFTIGLPLLFLAHMSILVLLFYFLTANPSLTL